MTSTRPLSAAWLSEPESLRFLISEKRCPSVLITCAAEVLQPVVARVAGICPRPLHARHLPGELSLPRERTGALLLWDVAHLTRGQQIELHDWMTARPGEAPVFSVTSIPLLPLVEDGRFLEGLFYRLNVVRLGIPVPLGRPDPHAFSASLFLVG